MEKVIAFVSGNTMVALMIGLVLLITIFLIFRRLVKILLVVMLIALAFWGYQHFRGPGADGPGLAASVREVIAKTTETGERLRQIYRDTGDWLGRGVVFFREQLGALGLETGGDPRDEPQKGQKQGK